jgi:RNA polymerase sigma-70 factor (ECF subfamily)
MSIEQFYQKHKDKLIGYACAFCYDYEFAEDAVHDSFIKAIVQGDTFKSRSESELLSWFYVVIKNKLIDQGRKKHRTEPYVEYIHDSIAKIELDSELELNEMLDSLPQDLAGSVWMRYLLGYNSKEIGKALGVNDATVRSRLKKAREMLKKDCNKD